jgi:hypothetical protein
MKGDEIRLVQQEFMAGSELSSGLILQNTHHQ